MKILHVLDHSIPVHSGYTFRTLAILRAQRAFGWQTFQLTSEKHPVAGPPIEEVEGFEFFRTPHWGGRVGNLPVLNQFAVIQGLSARLATVVEKVRPDIIHAHSPSLNGLAAVRAGRRAGIPVVYEVRALWEDGAVDHGTAGARGLRYRASRALENRVFSRANEVTTICEGLRAEISARGIVKRSVTVIPNAVDVERFHIGGSVDQELRKALGLDNTRVVGFIGSFYAYEGLSLLLDALPGLLERDPAIRLLLAGGGPEEQALKRRAADLGIASRVIFAGRVPNEKVPDYYNLADIMIYPRLPTRVTELVTPLKPLEAMALGRLVVVSDVGGQRELVTDGITGLAFRAGDRESLVTTVLSALQLDPVRRAEILQAARRFVETERTWVNSVRRYESVYQRALHPESPQDRQSIRNGNR